MKQYAAWLLTTLILVGAGFFYLTVKQYKIQIHDITQQLDTNQKNNSDLTFQVTKLQAFYAACTGNQMIKTSTEEVPFTYQYTGLYAPLIATQSGSIDHWDYNGAQQTEYQVALPPYNYLYLLKIEHTTEFPYLKSLCMSSKVSNKYDVCSAGKLNMSAFTYRGYTKKGFPYYQKSALDTTSGKTLYTTILVLPKTEAQENVTVQITYLGKSTDTDFTNYTSLINTLDNKAPVKE